MEVLAWHRPVILDLNFFVHIEGSDLSLLGLELLVLGIKLRELGFEGAQGLLMLKP